MTFALTLHIIVFQPHLSRKKIKYMILPIVIIIVHKST